MDIKELAKIQQVLRHTRRLFFDYESILKIAENTAIKNDNPEFVNFLYDFKFKFEDIANVISELHAFHDQYWSQRLEDENQLIDVSIPNSILTPSEKDLAFSIEYLSCKCDCTNCKLVTCNCPICIKWLECNTFLINSHGMTPDFGMKLSYRDSFGVSAS